MTPRYQAAQRLVALDPEQDTEEMIRLIVCCEFPFDAVRAMEMAFFRTFGIPEIARVLVGSGKFLAAPGQRILDTSELINTLVEGGYSSETGQEILRRINQAHGRIPRDTDLMRYVLGTFVFEPVRWVQRFGWRDLSPGEAQASFLFWREVGCQMGITVPDEMERFEGFYDDFERAHMVPAPANHTLAVRVRDHMLEPLPAAFRPLAREVVHAMLDARLREACALPAPRPWVRSCLPPLIRLRGSVASTLWAGAAPVLRSSSVGHGRI